MNVLNVEDVEREISRRAARLYHSHAKRWMMTVARNHVLGSLSEKDVQANYVKVCLCRHNGSNHDPEGHDPKILPGWALKAIGRGEPLVWFDTVQCGRRELWTVLSLIVLWFNNWKPDDTRLPRVDRISFPAAASAAVLWHKDVSANIWHYIKDRPVVVKECAHGYRWVRLVTALQFEREGRLMHHCCGNGNYYAKQCNNTCTYYSLRDRHNNPHVTMEISALGKVVQCKGNSNHKPDKLYQPYIRQLITDMRWSIECDANNID